MLKNYSELLKELNKMKGESITPRRKVVIKLLKGMVDTLDASLKYQKAKEKYDIKIDYMEHGNLLLSVFGSEDISSNEQKIKELRKALKEINQKSK